MDVLGQVVDIFQQRIDIVVSKYKSYYLLASEVTIYEIFCIIIKHLLSEQAQLQLRTLLDLISQGDNWFYFQMIGLPHLSKCYRNLSSPSQSDLLILKAFICANYTGILGVDDQSVWLIDTTSFTLNSFLKQKFYVDLKIVKETSQFALQDIDFSNFSIDGLNFYSQLIFKSEHCREKLAREYLSSFVERFYLERYYNDQYEALNETIDTQTQQRDALIGQLKQQTK